MKDQITVKIEYANAFQAKVIRNTINSETFKENLTSLVKSTNKNNKVDFKLKEDVK